MHVRRQNRREKASAKSRGLHVENEREKIASAGSPEKNKNDAEESEIKNNVMYLPPALDSVVDII